MIYSKKLNTYIPICIEKKEYDLHKFGKFTKYIISDGHIPVGYVDLRNTPQGVFVEMIKNNHPESYSGFGKMADQIEVEHCLNRGMDTFKIESNAALNSHALHYLRGKRFSPIMDFKKRMKLIKLFNTADANKIVENIIKTTQAGEKYVTDFLGSIPMYMPKNMIQKYLEIIKKTPLLK